MYFLAVDIGASSGRHIVGWEENGAVQTHEVYRFPNAVQDSGRHLVWDVDALVRNVKEGIRRAKKQYPHITSLSIDTWGVDYVLLDGEEEILPVYAYRDHRTQAVISKVHEKLPFSRLYRLTGCQFQPFNTVYQLYCDKCDGRLERATSMLMMPEYLLYKLCGNKAREYTNATTTGMICAQTGEFDGEIIRTLGYPKHLFPKLSRPGTVVGEYEGIRCVLCATHDTASAVEGIPMQGNHPYISSGTWSLLGVKTQRPITDQGSERANYSNEGGVGYNRYQKNIMGMWLVNELQRELCPDTPFPEIVRLARESSCEHLVDANGPEFLAPKSMKAAFDQATGSALKQPGDYFRCAYRSLARSYRQAIDELEANTGCTYKTLYIVGGGAKNDFLNQLTREATGKQVVALPMEATALGSLKIQMEEEKRMSYAQAKASYAAIGVDTDAAIARLQAVPVSVHCWQGDDVRGFDTDPTKPLTGGIQTTGNYPGRARTPQELMADLDLVLKLCPGTKKINLHASYAIFEEGDWADRDKLEPRHFKAWVDFCRERGLGCDFNPTFFSHPKCDPLTLSSPNEQTRRFWIDHGKACIRISQYLARELGQPCIMNIWTGDGFKDIPADRMGPRMRYKQALDEILSEPFDFELVKPCIESKVFGIGVEAYTVGSAEFALSYAAMNRDKCIPLMDNGHYHPTEMVSDKIPALLAFFPEIALHITRPIRWDSDHVVLLDDETREICKEIVRCGGLEGRVKIALDYFDASVNRVAAWTVGLRSVQKALLLALLTPDLTPYQEADNWTQLLVRQEELKTMPFGAVWAQYCRRCGVPEDGQWFAAVQSYEEEVLKKRG